eukprot:scaffold2293_cov221-Pinguiococcus_pyrenoidosus.AAC.5
MSADHTRWILMFECSSARMLEGPALRTPYKPSCAVSSVQTLTYSIQMRRVSIPTDLQKLEASPARKGRPHDPRAGHGHGHDRDVGAHDELLILGVFLPRHPAILSCRLGLPLPFAGLPCPSHLKM